MPPELKVDSPRPVRLRHIQQLVGSAIFRPLTEGYQMDPIWADGRKTADVAGAVIKPSDRLSSFERLEIYNRQYWFRIIDCFHDDFPGLRAILGTARFQRLARAYLAQYPSKSFTLRNLGQFLAEFLAAHPELTHPFTQAARDMAALEWAQILAFDGPSQPPLSPPDLQAQSPDSLRLTLQPHMTLLTAHYAVDDYLIAVRKLVRKAKGQIPLIRRRPKKERAPIHLAIHRHDNIVYYKRLAPAEFLLLSALRDGIPLSQALTAAFQQRPPDQLPTPDDIRAWFQNWTAAGWFAKPL